MCIVFNRLYIYISYIKLKEDQKGLSNPNSKIYINIFENTITVSLLPFHENIMQALCTFYNLVHSVAVSTHLSSQFYNESIIHNLRRTLFLKMYPLQQPLY